MGRERGWVFPLCARTRRGGRWCLRGEATSEDNRLRHHRTGQEDGSPHARGHGGGGWCLGGGLFAGGWRREEGMGFCMREDNGRGRVLVRGGRDGLRGYTGWGGFVFAGGRDGLAGSEDTGRGGGSGDACVFAGGGMGWRVRVREGEGYSRGKREGRDGGWVAGCVGTRDEGGFMFAGGGMGWRVREDTGRGRIRVRGGRDGLARDSRGHGTGARSGSRGGLADGGEGLAGSRGQRDGEGAFLFAGGGMGWRPPPSRGQGFDARTRDGGACSRGEGWVGGMREDTGGGFGWGRDGLAEGRGMGCRVRVREGMGARENGRGVVAFWLCCLLLCGFRAGAGKQRTYI